MSQICGDDGSGNTDGLPSCSPFVLVQSFHGCALLSHQLREHQADLLISHVGARMDQCSAPDLSNLLWSLATLRIDPGRPWVDAALSRCEVEIRGFSNGTMLSSTLWALAVLQHAPSSTWMEHYSWQVRNGKQEELYLFCTQHWQVPAVLLLMVLNWGQYPAHALEPLHWPIEFSYILVCFCSLFLPNLILFSVTHKCLCRFSGCLTDVMLRISQ